MRANSHQSSHPRTCLHILKVLAIANECLAILNEGLAILNECVAILNEGLAILNSSLAILNSFVVRIRGEEAASFQNSREGSEFAINQVPRTTLHLTK